MRNSLKILVEKPERNRPLGRIRDRWEDNITMDLRGTGWEIVDYIHVAQDRDIWRDLVNIVMNFRFL
jgi:hypothetical protein